MIDFTPLSDSLKARLRKALRPEPRTVPFPTDVAPEYLEGAREIDTPDENGVTDVDRAVVEDWQETNERGAGESGSPLKQTQPCSSNSTLVKSPQPESGSGEEGVRGPTPAQAYAHGKYVGEVVGRVKAGREQKAFDRAGDLTRWILDALDRPADDPTDEESHYMQRRIQAAIEAWFAGITQPEKCDRPPEGWRCSRDPGHDGPCAATPTQPPQGADRDLILVCGCGTWEPVDPGEEREPGLIRVEEYGEEVEHLAGCPQCGSTERTVWVSVDAASATPTQPLQGSQVEREVPKFEPTPWWHLNWNPGSAGKKDLREAVVGLLDEVRGQAAQLQRVEEERDHARQLQREEEWRAENSKRHWATELGDLRRERDRAEARIQEAVEEFERRAEEKVNARDKRRGVDNSRVGEKTVARIDGEAYGLRAAADLLRSQSSTDEPERKVGSQHASTDGAAARGSRETPAGDLPERSGEPGTQGCPGAGADPASARSRACASPLAAPNQPQSSTEVEESDEKREAARLEAEAEARAMPYRERCFGLNTKIPCPGCPDPECPTSPSTPAHKEGEE